MNRLGDNSRSIFSRFRKCVALISDIITVILKMPALVSVLYVLMYNNNNNKKKKKKKK